MNKVVNTSNLKTKFCNDRCKLCNTFNTLLICQKKKYKLYFEIWLSTIFMKHNVNETIYYYFWINYFIIKIVIHHQTLDRVQTVFFLFAWMINKIFNFLVISYNGKYFLLSIVEKNKNIRFSWFKDFQNNCKDPS